MSSRTLLLGLCLSLALPAGLARDAQAFDWLGTIEIDAEGLKSEDARLRLKAVTDLQRYAIEWTREHLLGALQDEDVNVRAAAGRILARHRIRKAVPIITRWLSETDVQSKEVAADILGELGDAKAVPALVRSLGDPEPSVRVHSIRALGMIGGDAVIIPLVTRLEDDKSDVRKAAVQVLRELGDARAVIPLVGLFDDSSTEVRTGAMEAVGVLGDAAAVPALVRELRENRDRAEAVKIAAITSLGNLEAVSALPDLLAALEGGSDQSSSDLRGKAAYSLAQIASAHESEPESQQALTRLVEALDETRMRNAAREALLRAGAAAVPTLIDYLQGKLAKGDPLSAVEILRSLGDKRATPVLISELERGRVPQQVVLTALSELGDSRALLPVLTLLEDKDPAVRLRAMHALDSMLGPQSEAADLIAERLEDSEIEIRLLAAAYLGRMRARSAVPALSKLARSGKEPAMRANALFALGRIGDIAASPVALEVLTAGPDELRAVAADVLTELGDRKALPGLLKLARNPKLSFRHFAIESLGAILRDSRHARASALLQDIARTGTRDDALAAIEALSGMEGDAGATVIERLAQSSEPERRRAALIALGAMRYTPSVPLLIQTLGSGTDADAGAAAWSLAAIPDRAAVPALLVAVRRGGLAAPVNASAALVRLVDKDDRKAIASLLHHQQPLVRVNAAMGLANIGDKSSAPRLESILQGDPSYLVRIACLRALSMLNLGSEAIAERAQQDPHALVRAAAEAIIKSPFAPRARDNWSVFRVVDPQAEDKAVAREARFFVGGDGIATVAFSDARGRIVYQQFPSGPFVEGAVSDLSRY